jgi:NAD(P)-dependent dehydrogenase (short-subunit alcohol dehydrogenase family)
VTQAPHTIVVGGTRGIGRTIARRLAGEGHAVSVIGRSAPSGANDDPPGTVTFWPADAADPVALDRALAEIVAGPGPASGMVLLQRFRGEGDDWTGEIATSLTATRRLLDWAGEHLEDRGGGKAVVVVSSIAGLFVAAEQPVSYHMAKAAVTQMVRYYAVSLGPKGIRVNAISPGTTVKDESKAFYAGHPELEQLYRDIVPLGRMGTADDVADVALFLLSARASFLTGQNLVVDGGVSLQSHESLARHVSPLRDLTVTRRRP